MKRLILPLVLSSVLMVAACAPASETSSSSVGSSTTSSSVSVPSGSLTLYSPHPTATINIGVEMFKVKYPQIKVEVVAAGTGELLNRIAAEKDNALGDVMWGGGAESLQGFAQYFEPYKPNGIENVDPIYYDSQFRWIGESPLPMVIMYNTNLVPANLVPTKWEDVLRPEFKGKIAMADPNRSGSAYTILLTLIQAFGKETGQGWFFVEDFLRNIDGKILSSSASVYRDTAAGNYWLGLTLEKAAQDYVIAGSPVKIVYPSEGTSATPDGAAIVKGAKNIENAKLWMDFIVSYELQDEMAKKVFRRSVRSDVASPSGLPALKDIKFIDYDFAWAADNRVALLDQFRRRLIASVS
jgi:iron(III) transport system substrate-binding protein